MSYIITITCLGMIYNTNIGISFLEDCLVAEGGQVLGFYYGFAEEVILESGGEIDAKAFEELEEFLLGDYALWSHDFQGGLKVSLVALE